MKFKYNHIIVTLLLSVYLFSSCEDFVEVAAPENKMVRDVVFENEGTAKSAMTGIYNELFRAQFSNGQRNSITILSGFSGDNISNIYDTNIERIQFEQNEITPDNSGNLSIWSSAYNIIYMTNSLLEGLQNSGGISEQVKNQLEGEARFIRAFSYFNLVNLYSDIPLLLTTDYEENQLSSRTPMGEVYEEVINDLLLAEELLGAEFPENERTRVNSYTASALLARVYLYLEDWDNAELYSSKVIDATSNYEILNDPEEVFLANSKEAIWQISPLGGGGLSTHTNEGNLLIVDPVLFFLAGIELEEELAAIYDQEDKRLANWIGYDSGLEVFFAHKYKIRNSNDYPIEEYSMVMRLAEQYLIRAEARAHLGDLPEALQDIDVIRKRAGISLISETSPEIGQQALLNIIMQERRKELFTEWGHRWFDLKRTGRADEVLGSQNPLWEATDIWYPIPSEERMRNPNLSQNEGY